MEKEEMLKAFAQLAVSEVPEAKLAYARELANELYEDLKDEEPNIAQAALQLALLRMIGG